MWGQTLGTALAAGALGAWVCGAAGAQWQRPPSAPYTWRNVQIVAGGFISGIVFSPKQRDLIYARTDIGGAYRWDPAAKRWIPLNDWVGASESNLLGIESIAPDPTDANRVYVAAGTYTQSWAGNGAILRSADQGRTWKRTDMPFKMGGNENGRSLGERLAVDPSKNSALYFGSRNDGLWKSSDAGATWAKVDTFPVTGRTNGIGIGFILFDPRGGKLKSPSPTIYVGVADGAVGLYRSRDAGATWQAVPGQPPPGLLPHHGVLASDGSLYVTYGNAPGPNGMSDGAVWKLNTRTDAWTDITPQKPGNPSGFGYAGLTVDAQHPQTVMVSTMDRWNPGDTLFRTTDGGAHWADVKPKSVRDSALSPWVNWGKPTADLGHWIGTLVLDPFRPGHALYGTGATMWGADDVTALDTGGTTHWTVRADGLEETAVLDLVSPPAGPSLISGLGDIGGFRHDDLAVSPRRGLWTNPSINNTDSIDFAEAHPAIVARVGRGSAGKNGAFSADGAATWTAFPSEPAGSQGGGTVAVSADGAAMVWTPRGGAPSVSRDRGATWTACAGLPGTLRVIADRADARKFYALDGSAGTVYVSTDGGATFAAVAGSSVPKGQGKLRAAPSRSGDLWLTAGNGGVFHSADGGVTFTPLPTVQEANALGFGKAAPGRANPALYLTGRVGGVAGVFRSEDAGANWVRVNDDAHQYGWIGQVITGDPRVYGRVYLGTNGRGIPYGEPKR